MVTNIGLMGAVFLACVLEFSEALAAVVAAAAKGGSITWPVMGAVAALVVVLGVGALAASALHGLPSRPLHLVVGATLLGIGAFWLKGAL